MATKVAAVSTTPRDFPQGTVGGPFRYLVMSSGSVVQQVDSSSTSQTFTLGAGTYTVEVQRLNAADGSILGSATSDTFTVVDTPVTVSVDVPASVTVS